MKWFNSIAFRLSTSIAVVVLATALTIASFILSEEQKTLENHLQIRALQLGEIMSQQIVEPLLYEELYTVFSLFQSYISPADSVITYAEVYDQKAELLLTSARDSSVKHLPVELAEYRAKPGFVNQARAIDEGKVFDLIYPVSTPSLGLIGYLRLGITPEHLIATIADVRRQMLTLTTVIVFFGVLAGLWMARRILKPILILNHAVLQLEEENLGEGIEVLGIGEIRGLTLSFNKMSKKLKESMMQIKKAQDTLLRKERLYVLGEFSAGLAHEIKNPLTPIKMLIQRSYEHDEPLEGDDLVIINDEIKRIDKIVSQFLGYARINEPKIETVDINKLIKDVIVLTQQKIKKSKVNLILNIEEKPLILDINADGLKQVVINLILNSLHAMPDGGTLTLSVHGNGKEIRMDVEDSGIGMSTAQIEKAFDPFFTTRHNGTGLGLAVVWQLVETFNGKVEIHSEPQQGTHVVVSLPYE